MQDFGFLKQKMKGLQDTQLYYVTIWAEGKLANVLDSSFQ